MSDAGALADRFRSLHQAGAPLLMPNPWDLGSAKLLASVGFQALVTTSSGFAASLGRLDGQASREEVIEHARAIAQATPLPVSADLENCFADEPEEVAETVGLAIGAGLAGCSIEDWSGEQIYPIDHAAARVAAAAEAARAGAYRLVLTARSENFLHGREDLADTIARLQAYQEAGADVLFAPGVSARGEIEALLRSVTHPVSALLMPQTPSVPELAELGVSRISVGGAFAYAAYAALLDAAEYLKAGSSDYLNAAGLGARAARRAFGP